MAVRWAFTFYSGVADKQCSELLTRTMKERYLPPEPFYLGDWRNSSAAVSETAGGGAAPPSPAISFRCGVGATRAALTRESLWQNQAPEPISSSDRELCAARKISWRCSSVGQERPVLTR